MKIAIIGAGISGLTASHYLKNSCDIHVFEKARGVSGRMSTRYADPYQFDHGAQYFTARSCEFKNFLTPLIAGNVVVEWKPRIMTLEKGHKPYKRDWFEPHFVAAPKMNAFCQYLAKDIQTHIQTRIVHMERNGIKWNLHDENGQIIHDFDWVISSMPQPQLLDLFPHDFKNLRHIHDVEMTGCFTMMIGFETAPSLLWDAAIVKGSIIEWIAVNSSKPSRNTRFSMVVNSTNAWAQSHIDQDVKDIEPLLLKALTDVLGGGFHQPDYVAIHKWRYANVAKPISDVDTPYIMDRSLNLAACGDWFLDGRVEAAFQSGYALAQAMVSG